MYPQVYRYEGIHTYIHTYIHTCMHACMHTSMHACVHACMHACMHTYLYTYKQVYIHTYIHAYMRAYICRCFLNIRTRKHPNRYLILPLQSIASGCPRSKTSGIESKQEASGFKSIFYTTSVARWGWPPLIYNMPL